MVWNNAKEREMAYSFACKDTGLVCPGEFTSESEDELMRQLDAHYKQAHLGLKPMEYRLKKLIKVS